MNWTKSQYEAVADIIAELPPSTFTKVMKRTIASRFSKEWLHNSNFDPETFVDKVMKDRYTSYGGN